MEFNVKKTTRDIIEWIREFFLKKTASIVMP